MVTRSQRQLRRSHFTLLEVLVALLILGLMLGGVMGLASQSCSDVIAAQQLWERERSLDLATEYFLLAPPGTDVVPDSLLPAGYHATCRVEVATDHLPDQAQADRQGWVLVEYTIALHDPRGQPLKERSIFKILPRRVL